MARRLEVRNVTRGTALVEAGAVADNPWTRVKGLLGRTGLEPGDGLLIVPCGSIHSCFMKFEFDALFLSRTNEVVHLIEKMPPGKFSKMVWQAKSVLEMPAGMIAQSQTQIGDQLDIAVTRV